MFKTAKVTKTVSICILLKWTRKPIGKEKNNNKKTCVSGFLFIYFTGSKVSICSECLMEIQTNIRKINSNVVHNNASMCAISTH